MDNYKVSIIVPVYNTEKYLSECLDSLINQTLEDIEIIVVNDGSTDNSQAIIDKYASRYPQKIVSLIKENSGLSSARNFGVAHARGEFLGFVDSDDRVDPEMYEKMYDKAIEEASDIVCCGITHIYSTTVTKYFFDDPTLFGSSVAEKPQCLISSESYACTKIYRRSMWLENNISFPSSNIHFENTATIYGALLYANRVSAVNEPLYLYNKTNENSITNIVNDRILDIFTACSRMLETYRSQNMFEHCNKQLEFICLKHIFIRVSALKKASKSRSNKKLAKAFVEEVFAFLDENFPNWKSSKYFAKKSSLTNKSRIYCNLFFPNLLKKALHAPRWLNRKLNKLIRCYYTQHKKIFRSRENNNMHGENPIEVYRRAIKQLDSLHLTAFAEFSTLLHISAQGSFPKSSSNFDIGVSLNDISTDTICKTMEHAGFTLAQRYITDNSVKKEVYSFEGVKTSFYYYTVTDSKAEVYWFYRNPKESYPGRTCRSIRLLHSKLPKPEYISLDDINIAVPENYKEFLGEIYADGIETINPGTAVQSSPIRVSDEKNGRIIAYKYKHFPIYEFKTENGVIKTISGPENKRLKELQAIELELLREFKRVCEKLNLTYYLAEGTLLGAIRHNGFIPWDDDIDVMMPRKDYERLIKDGRFLFENGYLLQHHTFTENWWSIFAKLRYTKPSPYSQPEATHLTENNGPYLDIFPLDTVPQANSALQRKQKKRISFLRFAMFYKLESNYPKKVNSLPMLFYGKLHSVKSIYKKLDKAFLALSDDNCKYYQSLANYYNANAVLISDYGKGKMHKFEDDCFAVPDNAENILKAIYGDYMRLPPANRQKSKHLFAYNENYKAE